jgi:hypothetical protein
MFDEFGLPFTPIHLEGYYSVGRLGPVPEQRLDGTVPPVEQEESPNCEVVSEY